MKIVHLIDITYLSYSIVICTKKKKEKKYVNGIGFYTSKV